MSHKQRLGYPGLGLIDRVPDSSNRRGYLLVLTEKGELLSYQLESLLPLDYPAIASNKQG